MRFFIKHRLAPRTFCQYHNIPASLDIETSSIRTVDDAKFALMHDYEFNINGKLYNGRTTDDFERTIKDIQNDFNTSYNHKRLVIYVHNLSYEFQFLKHHLNLVPEDVFSVSKIRTIAKAITIEGIEFRCHYLLTGKSLDRVGKELKLTKLKDDYDYSLTRTPFTKREQIDKDYLAMDNIIVIENLKKLLKQYNICSIPMTKTGIVRRDVLTSVKKDDFYLKQINQLQVTLSEYYQLRDTYSGGITRANALYTNKIIKNVVGFDIKSSYIYSLIFKKYPMSTGIEIFPSSIDELKNYFTHNAVLTTMTLTNLSSKREIATMSKSKCEVIGYSIVDNGRLRYADKVIVPMNEVDFKNYSDYYDFEIVNIGRTYIYKKDYLPKPLILKILDYFNKKTSWDGVIELAEEYNFSKENLNSIYGMMVTTLLHANYTYDIDKGILQEDDINEIETIYDVNNNERRFTFYPWGVWCTSYSREHLLQLNTKLEDIGIKVIYGDTDSWYFQYQTKANKLINTINENIIEEIKAYSLERDIDIDLLAPKTRHGISTYLGTWEYDSYYKTFKTLGAKRYAGNKRQKDGSYKFVITVAGLSKNANDYIHSKGGLRFFNDNMVIPQEHSGRLIATYIDEPITTSVTDYKNNTYNINSLSSTHLEPSSYNLSINGEYKELLTRLNLEQSKKDNKK